MALQFKGGKAIPANTGMTASERTAAQEAYQTLEKVVPLTRSLWTKFQEAGMGREAGQMNQAHETISKLLLRISDVLKK